MIQEIKMENHREVLEHFRHINTTIFDQVYSSEEIANMILNIIKYIEIRIHCNLIESIVTIRLEKNKVILPFWPISEIISVKNKINVDIPYKIHNNKLEIFDDNEDGYYIVKYKIGYPLSILKQLPIAMIIEEIMTNYNGVGLFTNNTVINTLLENINAIYGMGD